MMLILALIACTAAAMIIHELGHLYAARACGVRASEVGLGLGPRLCGFNIRGVLYSLRALPLGSFVRLDGTALRNRPLSQQLFVHLAGVLVNLAVAVAARGTLFGMINLLLAVGNLLPIYQHDGWKCGVAMMRALLRRQSRPVEWVFTFSGGLASVVIGHSLLGYFR